MSNSIPRAHSFGTSITTLFTKYTTGNQAQEECPRCNLGRPASGALPLGMARLRTCWMRHTLMVSWSYSAPCWETSCIGPSPSRTPSSVRRMGHCSRVLIPRPWRLCSNSPHYSLFTAYPPLKLVSRGCVSAGMGSSFLISGGHVAVSGDRRSCSGKMCTRDPAARRQHHVRPTKSHHPLVVSRF